MKKKPIHLFMFIWIFMIFIVCYSRYMEPERLVMKEITVETNMDIEKCWILFFTDTHFGTLYDGNHDYGGGAVRIYEQFMNNCGFYVLDNETVFLEKFNIEVIGFDDYLLGQTEVDFYHIQSDNFHLIVTHEPVISKWIEGSGENLILSEKNKELPSLYS